MRATVLWVQLRDESCVQRITAFYFKKCQFLPGFDSCQSAASKQRSSKEMASICETLGAFPCLHVPEERPPLSSRLTSFSFRARSFRGNRWHSTWKSQRKHVAFLGNPSRCYIHAARGEQRSHLAGYLRIEPLTRPSVMALTPSSIIAHGVSAPTFSSLPPLGNAPKDSPANPPSILE